MLSDCDAFSEDQALQACLSDPLGTTESNTSASTFPGKDEEGPLLTRSASASALDQTYIQAKIMNSGSKVPDKKKGKKLEIPLCQRSMCHVLQFLEANPSHIDDRDFLSFFLSFFIPKRRARLAASLLLERYGSVAAVLAAPAEELLCVAPVDIKAVTALKAARAATCRVFLDPWRERPVLGNWDLVVSYLRASFAGEQVEQLRVLCLDARNQLIADVVQARGSPNFVAVEPQDILRTALERRASAFILVHNHPSGNPMPSLDDVQLTRIVERGASALGLSLHDHVIVAGQDWISLKRLGLLGG